MRYKGSAKVVYDRATRDSGFCLLRGAEMLNIRENIAKIAVMSVYGLVLGALPHALATDALSTEERRETIVVADPLDEFRNAKTLDETELKELLEAVGFEGKALRVAWTVAMKESNGRPVAYNGNTRTGDSSYGIFQINMLGDLGPARRDKFDLKSNKELFDPVTNAEIAYYMTAGGTDWSSWKINPNQNNGTRYSMLYKEYPKE